MLGRGNLEGKLDDERVGTSRERKPMGGEVRDLAPIGQGDDGAGMPTWEGGIGGKGKQGVGKPKFFG